MRECVSVSVEVEFEANNARNSVVGKLPNGAPKTRPWGSCAGTSCAAGVCSAVVAARGLTAMVLNNTRTQ